MENAPHHAPPFSPVKSLSLTLVTTISSPKSPHGASFRPNLSRIRSLLPLLPEIGLHFGANHGFHNKSLEGRLMVDFAAFLSPRITKFPKKKVRKKVDPWCWWPVGCTTCAVTPGLRRGVGCTKKIRKLEDIFLFRGRWRRLLGGWRKASWCGRFSDSWWWFVSALSLGGCLSLAVGCGFPPPSGAGAPSSPVFRLGYLRLVLEVPSDKAAGKKPMGSVSPPLSQSSARKGTNPLYEAPNPLYEAPIPVDATLSSGGSSHQPENKKNKQKKQTLNLDV